MDGIEPDKNNSNPAGCPVVLPLIPVSSHNPSDDEVGDCHADAPYDEDGLAPESVDVQDGRNCCEKHDHANYTGSE